MAQTAMNCEYRHYLNNGIHKLIIQNKTTAAVDEALHHLKHILNEQPVDETLYLFIDARAGVPPLQYFFSHLRRLYKKYEQLPEIRAVYLYEESIMLSMLQMFFNTLRLNASRRFIRGGTELEAQEWLLSEAD